MSRSENVTSAEHARTLINISVIPVLDISVANIIL